MQQQKKEKRKRFLIMLPVFVAPIIFLAYLLLPGREKKAQSSGAVANKSAFNAKLPSANIKEAGKNKLEIYMQAQLDSAKRQDQLRNDPYEKQWFNPAPPIDVQQQRVANSKRVATAQSMDANEQKVNERLDQLMRELNRPEVTQRSVEENTALQNQIDVAGLEQLMKSLNNPDIQDPELDRIELLLEKILDIQHPDRVKHRLSENRDTLSTTTYFVGTHPEQEYGENNRFYGLQEDYSVTGAPENSTILAEVPEDQLVHTGSTISFRLLQDVFVGGQLIPKGSRISGRCELSNDRVNVQLNEIAFNNIIYPISLVAYDLDGIKGIKVPGAEGQDEAKNSLSQTIQSMDVYSGAPSITGQAAQAGIQAAKNIFSKRARKATATVKATHKILLKKAFSN